MLNPKYQSKPLKKCASNFKKAYVLYFVNSKCLETGQNFFGSYVLVSFEYVNKLNPKNRYGQVKKQTNR